MALPKRPRDPVERSKLIFDMLTGEVPNDKDQVLGAPTEPTGPAKAAKARAVSQSPERRSEVARKAAAARWNG